MSAGYLPKSSSIADACKWLQDQTDSDWSLARMLENGLRPWIWLDYSPEAPQGIFGDRSDGYFAPILFAGDTHRLEMNGADVVVTMTRTHDGKLFMANPGLRFPLSALRFKRGDLQRLADSAKVGAGGATDCSKKIPGKLPRVAIGRLAIEAAWQIECETKRAPTAAAVMSKLQDWADAGEHAAVLSKSDKKNKAVCWVTGKGKQKCYDQEACGKTLETWGKSRA